MTDSDQSTDVIERTKKGLEALANNDLGGAHYEFANATVEMTRSAQPDTDRSA